MTKWHTIEHPPKIQGKYLTVVDNEQIHILNYVHGRWYGYPYISGSDINVTHWMNVPGAPQPKDWVYHV